MKAYKYKPVMFFAVVFVLTWIFWISAAITGRVNPDSGIGLLLMILGLFVPLVIALVMVLTSKSPALKKDYKDKLFGIYRVKPSNIIISIGVMVLIIMASILISLLFGQSADQFAFTEGFSFSVGGVPTLLTLVLTASLEELGWRGYAMDSIASRFSWFKASMIFGILWGLWHLPLFFIPETYQNNIMQMNIWYMVNFFAGVIPMVFLFTWVYLKNNRSILACTVFHFFVNFLQEQIAMTQTTKCIESGVVLIAAIIVVAADRKMFFETNMPEI